MYTFLTLLNKVNKNGKYINISFNLVILKTSDLPNPRLGFG